MDIRSVRAYALSSPIEPNQDRQFHGGVRRLKKRDFVLVVCETVDGTRGIAPAGASSSAMREFFEGATKTDFAEVIETDAADAVTGVEIEEPADVHGLLADSTVPEALRGEVAGALDVALYDIRGKEVGAPVAELLAEGEIDDELPLYASAGMYMEPEGYAEQAEILEDLGFFGYKYRPGIGPEGDRETIRLLEERLSDIEVMIDAHTWWKIEEDYDRETITALAQFAADHDAYWLEEPVAPDDYDGYRHLAAETDVPLAGGESEENVQGLLDLADTGAVSFLQGDVRHHGGFTGCMEAIEHCAGTDVSFVPHNFGTWLGLVSNAHLVAGAPECELLEYPVFEDDPALDHPDDPGMYPFSLAFDVIEGSVEIADGHMTVPDAPGLGVEPNLDVLEEYPYTEGPWTEFLSEAE